MSSTKFYYENGIDLLLLHSGVPIMMIVVPVFSLGVADNGRLDMVVMYNELQSHRVDHSGRHFYVFQCTFMNNIRTKTRLPNASQPVITDLVTIERVKNDFFFAESPTSPKRQVYVFLNRRIRPHLGDPENDIELRFSYVPDPMIINVSLGEERDKELGTLEVYMFQMMADVEDVDIASLKALQSDYKRRSMYGKIATVYYTSISYDSNALTWLKQTPTKTSAYLLLSLNDPTFCFVTNCCLNTDVPGTLSFVYERDFLPKPIVGFEFTIHKNEEGVFGLRNTEGADFFVFRIPHVNGIPEGPFLFKSITNCAVDKPKLLRDARLQRAYTTFVKWETQIGLYSAEQNEEAKNEYLFHIRESHLEVCQQCYMLMMGF